MRIEAAVTRDRSGGVRLESLELEEPQKDEVLVRVEAVGICHTDLSAPALCPLPAVFGHEGAGVIEAVGGEVHGFAPGDRVLMTFGSCGGCRACEEGEPAYCANMMALQFSGRRLDGSITLAAGDAPVHGAFFQQSSFATHALATARNVVRLPDWLPFDVAAPFGCGVQTGAGAVLNTLAARPGQSLAVFGVGGVGLPSVMAAVVAGCDPIIAIDVDPARLELALELGATHAIEAGGGEVAGRVHAIVPGGVDLTVETAGQVETFQAAIDALAMRGVCALVTVPTAHRPLPFDPLSLLMGRAVRGVLEGGSVPGVFLPQLFELHRRGLLPVERLIRRYPFASIGEALEDARAGRVVKPVLIAGGKGPGQSG